MMYTEENFELTIPTNISFTLHKYDYIDSIIISRVLKECKNTVSTFRGKDKGIYKISVESFRQAIQTSKRLVKELEKNKEMSIPSPNFKVNSLFFLWNIIGNLPNLKWLTFKISHDKDYTRLIDIKDKQILTFHYNVEEGLMHLPTIFSREDLDTFNKEVISQGLMENKYFDRRGYFWMRASNLFDLMASLEKKGVDVMSKILQSVDPKIDEDDPMLLVITDYTNY